MEEEIKEQEKYRLPKEFTEKWLTALRSGDYEQNHNALCTLNNYEDPMTEHNKYSYCCLGVACVIAYDQEFLETINFMNAGYPVINLESLSSLNTDQKLDKIPMELQSSLSLPKKLAILNDDDGFTFEEIADWIEQNVELY